MNLKVFKCYMNVCNSIGIIPSWTGLERFRLYCLWERESSVRD